jgi:hypothetical protein
MNAKIKSPKTNRLITINGVSYNKLISSGEYTKDYLSSLHQLPLDDTDLQIIKQVKDVYSLCQANKRLYNLCMKNNLIKEQYFKQQDIYKRIDKIVNYLNTYKSINISVTWNTHLYDTCGYEFTWDDIQLMVNTNYLIKCGEFYIFKNAKHQIYVSMYGMLQNSTSKMLVTLNQLAKLLFKMMNELHTNIYLIDYNENI